MRPTVLPGSEPAWWLRDADDGDRSPALDRDLDVDVAIVGGGFTGLWTALALRALPEPPTRVALLEAEFCGWGPSGRNGGFCHGYWSYLPTLCDLFGDEAALRLCAAGDRIIPGIRVFLAERGEDAWFKEDGLLEVSTAEAQDPEIDGQVAAARAVGHAEEAERSESRPASRRVFRRGVFFRDGATVHPGAARSCAQARCARRRSRAPRGNARATAKRRDHRGERPHSARRRTSCWRRTPRSPAGGRLRGRLTIFGTYVVLTEPVPELLQEIGWTGGAASTTGACSSTTSARRTTAAC